MPLNAFNVNILIEKLNSQLEYIALVLILRAWALDYLLTTKN
ncbi:uncharacterized protein FFNC_00002 [Fusarium fujikuroi]|nr:uncharacterized protein FFC1_00003 [Fusarium fujikuroi]SCO27880.1 uncharacterized protein FFNC_00002 [Fusarium fujikuroi]